MCKVVLTFESVDEIQKSQHSNVCQNEHTCCDKSALAASDDSLNTTNEGGKSYLAPLRLSGQKNV